MESGTARDTDQKGPDMTATTAIQTSGRHPRPLVTLANLALAGAALTVSLIAITTDDHLDGAEADAADEPGLRTRPPDVDHGGARSQVGGTEHPGLARRADEDV